MTKVFISQPMRSKTKQEICEERENAFFTIHANIEDAVLIDSIIDEKLEEKYEGVRYLGKIIEMMDDADMVFMLEGWESARGCRIEHEVAKAYGIPVYYF